MSMLNHTVYRIASYTYLLFSQENRQIESVLQHPAMDLTPLLPKSSDDPAQNAELVQSADRYFYRALLRMAKLRDAAERPSRDLSNREVTRSANFLENLLHRLLAQRTFMTHLLPVMDRVRLLCARMQTIRNADVIAPLSAAPFPAQRNTRTWMSAQKMLLERTCEVTAECELLVAAIAGRNADGAPAADLNTLSQSIARCKSDLEATIAQFGIAERSAQAFAECSEALVHAAERALVARNFATLSSLAQTTLCGAPVAALPPGTRSQLAALAQQV